MEKFIWPLMKRGMLEKEALVYLTALELASAPASTIARKANIKRTTAYAILRDLEQRGIATSIIRKQLSYFSVVDPEQLLSQLQEKCQEFQQIVGQMQNLKDIYATKPRVDYYEGISWLKQVYSDILKECDNKVIYGFIGAEGIDPDLESYLINYNIPQRVAKGIFAKIIVSDTPANKRYAWLDSIGLKQTKIISWSVLQHASEISLYGSNKVCIVMYWSDELYATVITSKHLYDNRKSIFDYLCSI